jgi:rhodanese-related sulfurtransferase
MAVAAAGLLLMGASPAAPPDFPVSYISVEELKELLDRRARVDVIDVRTRDEYDALHIKGARSLPLRTVRERAAAIPRAGLVVLY